MKKILIINSDKPEEDKAMISNVVISCNGEQARIIKDRNGIAFNASFMSSHILQFIEATYPGYEVEDCHV